MGWLLGSCNLVGGSRSGERFDLTDLGMLCLSSNFLI